MPDFIIIGAMKCATSTLHEQLARQPGIFMSTPKEPNFFSDDDQYARGIQWYSSLFGAAPPDALCGESSTHYTKLPTWPRTIERMVAHVRGGVKLIYVMRHPIDRLISQYIHEWTQRVISCPIDAATDRHPELIEYSRYSMQLRPYFEAFGRENVLPMFSERLAVRPQDELERAAEFIGFTGQPKWDDALGEQNVSSQRLRRHSLRDALINLPVAKQLRRALVPQPVRDRIKRLWTMNERPQLSAAKLARLQAIFDEDLAHLGRWLGMELRCSNFKQTVTTRVPSWKPQASASAA